MEKLSIDDVIPYIESQDIAKHSVAIRYVENSLSENEHTLSLLIEQYYVSYSQNILNTINSVLNESRAQRMFDLVTDYTKDRQDSFNLKPTLQLLTKLLSRTDPEPTWMYLLVEHELLDVILTLLQMRSSRDSVPLGIVFVSMLLPLAPVKMSAHFDTLVHFLHSTLSSYQTTVPMSGYLQRLCFHYFVTLYSIYPYKLLSWTKSLPADSPSSLFIQKCGPFLRLHSALYTSSPSSSSSSSLIGSSPSSSQPPTQEYAESYADRESHDIIWEINCYSEQFDLLFEAQMIEVALKKEVTELHDISWESTHLNSRSIACQTENSNDIFRDCSNHAVCPKVDDKVIRSYLDKKITASASLFLKRKASRRFEPDDTECTRPELAALEGELMLEKYLRYQHERRNRRYLLDVRLMLEEKSHHAYYQVERERLTSELARAEGTIAELTRANYQEQTETHKQLMDIAEELARMRDLKVNNRELVEINLLNTKKMKQLEDQVEVLSTEKNDALRNNRELVERVNQMNVLEIRNTTLTNKVNQLQNQLFVVNEIRSYQCDALNALKPFCYKTKSHPYIEGMQHHVTNTTPEMANLQKLSSETSRKLDVAEKDVSRLNARFGSLNDEITRLKEKLQKQKDLTEKTTNFWEQKYSGLEKTCQTYKNTHQELYQHTLKLKRDLEKRGRH